jgi:two-component system NtrC family sensor kinase
MRRRAAAADLVTMTLFDNLRPKFWNHVDVGVKSGAVPFNYRKIWRLTAALTLTAALVPLVIISMMDYRVTQEAITSEILLRTSRLVANTRRSITYFLAERRAALDYVNRSVPFSDLVAPDALNRVLEGLKDSFGGFVDIGVINDDGLQVAYAGPYDLAGKDYSRAAWFADASVGSVYVSDVFLGFRNVPHMVIAVKHRLQGDSSYILRATLDTTRLNDLLSGLEVGGAGDAFMINTDGVLQTRSRSHGTVMRPVALDVPAFAERSRVVEKKGPDQKALIIGYAYIPETPFILMIVKHKDRLMVPWRRSRLQLLAFLVTSVAGIIVVVLGGITYLVNQIYLSDIRRQAVIHKVEYANKMASLGRLSAGVAHEINNPLAIINEKAGLIKDLFQFKKEYDNDPRLLGLINTIISSVDRCANITRRLLNFARHSGTQTRTIVLGDIIHEVLGFLGKEAEYRCIAVNVTVAEDIPPLQSDPGRLQEIFLNLITNAFAAMTDCGRLEITAARHDAQHVRIAFADSGHGIRREDIDKVFEPFFSTKTGVGGTGLGLSITYGLVHELGGKIWVDSTEGEGTTFTILLPLASPSNGEAGASDAVTEEKEGT